MQGIAPHCAALDQFPFVDLANICRPWRNDGCHRNVWCAAASSEIGPCASMTAALPTR